jgi:hypothetical protein
MSNESVPAVIRQCQDAAAEFSDTRMALVKRASNVCTDDGI